MEEFNTKAVDACNPSENADKELQDTKAYLDIVLKELEETKAKIPSAPTRKKKNIWRVAALLEAVIVLSGGVIWFIYQKNKESIPVMNAQENSQEETIDPIVQAPTEATTKIALDLNSLVKKYDSGESGFKASVQNVFGYEYLSFTKDNLTIYYRNEFPVSDTNRRQKILIDNGTRLCEFSWDYDFSMGLDWLCPYYGNFFEEEGEQLVFPVYHKEDSLLLPEQIHVVKASNLWEYDWLDVPQKMNEVLASTYEEVGSDHVDPDVRMKLKFGSATYTYAIDKDAYVDAVYYDEDIVKFKDYFQLNLQENQIQVQTIPYLSENEYLGEFSAELTLQENQVTLGKTSFAAYALANQDDVDNEGIIKPSDHIYSEDRIKLWGRKGESYLLELSDKVDRNRITQDKLVKNEDGKYTYQDEDVKSIPGIDVSKFQGEIDWNEVKKSGVEFAILRVGFRGFNEGTLELDPCFEQNIKGATKAGVKVGVYFFSQAVNKKEAAEEAAFVLEQIKDYPITYPVIIDTEFVSTYAARANNLSRQSRTDIAKTFCKAVEKAGYHPMIYANTKWMIMGIDLEQLQDYDLWFAYYGDDLTFPYRFDMFQYSDRGQVPGIKGNVDLNISLKDYSIREETAHTPD